MKNHVAQILVLAVASIAGLTASSRGQVSFYTNSTAFNNALAPANQVFDVTENFEGASAFGFTCNPLTSACTTLFSAGDIPATLSFQIRDSQPGDRLGVLGVGAGAAINKAVGPERSDNSFDIISSPGSGHTAMILSVVNLSSPSSSSMQVSVYDSAGALAGSSTPSIANGTDIGFIYTAGTIGRVNLVTAGNGSEQLYSISVYTTGPFCGDGIINGSDTCDDGVNNGAGNTFCLSDCTGFQTCGNGATEGTEVCDDGDAVDCAGGTCRGDCSAMETGCGDGFVCGYETCDGNGAGTAMLLT